MCAEKAFKATLVKGVHYLTYKMLGHYYAEHQDASLVDFKQKVESLSSLQRHKTRRDYFTDVKEEPSIR